MPQRRPLPRSEDRSEEAGKRSIDRAVRFSIRHAGQLPQLRLQVLKVEGLGKKIRGAQFAAQRRRSSSP